ncbi:MAG: hypothetical protein JSW20_06780, partial [Nitrospiraceae bacterium]
MILHRITVVFIICALSLCFALSLPALAQVATLVRTTDASMWSPPSPDSAGIVYIDAFDTLLVCDSEVNEIPALFTGDNLFKIDLNGTLLDTLTTFHFSDEPTGVAYNPYNNHLFFSDDTGTKSVYELDPGADGFYGTTDDIVTSFSTSAFGSDDPEGVTYNTAQGVLHIIDGVNEEVYTVNPGVNGIFDGVPPMGDDQVTSFDTTVLGTSDPEGIAYDSDFGHLYIAASDTSVVHATTDGELVRTIDMSEANARKLSGLAYAPSSVNPGEMSLYIVDRGTDNDSDPNENDGKVYEFSLPPFNGNALPVVTITMPSNGSMINLGDTVTFTGTALDAEDGDLTGSMVWTSSLDGPIGSGGLFLTSTLSLGTHIITASVNDSGGQSGSDMIMVMVYPEGAVSIEVQVASGSDDAEERDTGSLSLTSRDLELVVDGSRGAQTVGMRFIALTIPPQASIFHAHVQFQVDEISLAATSLTIEGEATDNAATFIDISGNISSRSTTSSFVSWNPVSWTMQGEIQSTPSIRPIIQEIVNRPGWSSGNSMVIIVTGTGTRTAESFNGDPLGAPLLHIDYLPEVYSYPDTMITNPSGGTLSGAFYVIDGTGTEGTDPIDEVQVSTDNGGSWNP